MKISSLKKGDEVVIKPHIGYPDAEVVRTAIIADVDTKDGIAITSDGIRLRDDVNDGAGVRTTGKKYETFDLEKAAIDLIAVRKPNP